VQYGEGLLLHAMVYTYKPQLIIELGLGMSTLFMAEACRSIHFSHIIAFDHDGSRNSRLLNALIIRGTNGFVTLVDGTLPDILNLYEFSDKASRTLIVIDENHVKDEVLCAMQTLSDRLSGNIVFMGHDCYHDMGGRWAFDKFASVNKLSHVMLPTGVDSEDGHAFGYSVITDQRVPTWK